ncbi:hypothetical protein GGI25_000069 [Coemansia spiralis]|uniref:Proline--tRNA ligase n=1 Tax=Coemansia spiralis TaxID=417178 RepID=A0A9W8KZS2_9FUNG|nr:hypothetical protein GGI25_000069 [Coemansia spiralis]
MADISALITKLSSLGLNNPTVEHAAADNVEQWAEVLAGASNVPKHVLTKTLIFKPKQPKADPVAPIMVIAKSDTAVNSKALGSELKLKEPRFASEDILSEMFKTQKGAVSPFALGNVPKENIAHVRVVIDKALLGADAVAFHPLQNTRTVFVTGETLQAYIRSIEGLAHVSEIDLAALSSDPPAQAAKKPAASSATAQASKVEEATGSAKLGIEIAKEADFSKWYQQVLTRSDMLDYYDVSGCYIVRPLAYFVWQQIQEFFDAGIRALGVKNCYFPMFVSQRALQREKDHVEGFAPEVAWVTKAGSSDLPEPVAIRPTSETVMYPYFADWIRSHRDLPLKLNQWCSVVRWEFKNPQPFLRTREFLWQEGHCAYLTEEGAMTEVRDILTLYRRVYEELLAVPVVEGIKSEKEKFAGGAATTTVEGFIPATGRGIQGGTSHYLGQNFSKMFNIVVEDPKAPGDNKGLVMPPRVAETQVIIIPTGLTVKHSDAVRRQAADACLAVEARLRAAGVRAECDLRENYTPGFKFSHWEVRGVPVRLEIGPAELEQQTVRSVRRDTFEKTPLALAELEASVQLLLVNIQDSMLARARRVMDERIKMVFEWTDFVPTLNNKCLVVIPWCEREECEEQIKERSSRDELGDEPEDEKAPSMGAKSLCLPFKQPKNPPLVPGETKCVQCGQNAKRYAMFGRSY